MTKGFIYSLETIFVFIAWMMILLLIWQESAFWVNEKTTAWNREKALEYALAQSDALILQHSSNPWLGCAHYSNERKRILEYVMEKNCLERLTNTPHPSEIVRVTLFSLANEQILVEKQMDATKTCAGIKRLVILRETNEINGLEVVACD